MKRMHSILTVACSVVALACSDVGVGPEVLATQNFIIVDKDATLEFLSPGVPTLLQATIVGDSVRLTWQRTFPLNETGFGIFLGTPACGGPWLVWPPPGNGATSAVFPRAMLECGNPPVSNIVSIYAYLLVDNTQYVSGVATVEILCSNP